VGSPPNSPLTTKPYPSINQERSFRFCLPPTQTLKLNRYRSTTLKPQTPAAQNTPRKIELTILHSNLLYTPNSSSPIKRSKQWGRKEERNLPTLKKPPKKRESRFFKSLLAQNAKIADANLRTLLQWNQIPKTPKNRATKSVIARSSPLHGPSRASLAWKSTKPVGATTGTGYSQERQLGDAGSAVYTPPTPTG